MGAMTDTPWAGQTFAPPTPLDIATVEAAIVARLKDSVGDQVAIEHFPDDPKRYRMTHRVGAILARFEGEQFGELEEAGIVLQERTVEWRMTVLVRDLGWSYGGQPGGPSPGAYQILDAIRAALTGFEIPGCRKMYPIRSQAIGHDSQQGVWRFEATYRHKTVAIEPSTQDNFPILQKVANRYSDGAVHIEDVDTPGAQTP